VNNHNRDASRVVAMAFDAAATPRKREVPRKGDTESRARRATLTLSDENLDGDVLFPARKV
jgi:hypothetical protein